MFDDASLRSALRGALRAPVAPSIDLAEIHRRRRVIAPRANVQRRGATVYRAAGLAAAAFVALLVVALQAGAVVQFVGTRVEVALRALRIANPPPTANMIRAMKVQTRETTLRSAQQHVRFTIVPPTGLPASTKAVKIVLTPTAAWDAKSNAWHEAEDVVRFTVVRANGARFDLTAQRYDPHEVLSAYTWETLERADGTPIVRNGRMALIRHDCYHWRNGDQVMSAVVDSDVSAREIERIRAAMHGTPLMGVKRRAPRGGNRLIVRP